MTCSFISSDSSKSAESSRFDKNRIQRLVSTNHLGVFRPSPRHIFHFGFRTSQVRKPFVGGMPDESLEPKPNCLGIRCCIDRLPRFPQEKRVDVKRLLHTYNYAICVWLFYAERFREGIPPFLPRRNIHSGRLATLARQSMCQTIGMRQPDEFLGYGSPSARIWLVGPEERAAGKDDPSGLLDLNRALRKAVLKEVALTSGLADVREFHLALVRKMKQESVQLSGDESREWQKSIRRTEAMFREEAPALQWTWSRLGRLCLAFDGRPTGMDLSELRKLQTHEIGQSKGFISVVELRSGQDVHPRTRDDCGDPRSRAKLIARLVRSSSAELTVLYGSLAGQCLPDFIDQRRENESTQPGNPKVVMHSAKVGAHPFRVNTAPKFSGPNGFGLGLDGLDITNSSFQCPRRRWPGPLFSEPPGVRADRSRGLATCPRTGLCAARSFL